MSRRYCAVQLFIKRWICPHVSRRTFANGNAKYNEAIAPIHTRELEKRARILKTWQDQLEKEQLDAESDLGLEQQRNLKPSSGTKNAPIWLPQRPVVRKVKIDATTAAVAGAISYYLKPRKGNARAKAEQAAAADPMLQYALSPENSSYRGDKLDEALDKAFQIGKGNSERDVPERQTGDTVDEGRDPRRRQAEEDWKRYAESKGMRRSFQLQHKSLNFTAAVTRWKRAHLPPAVHDSHTHTRRALNRVANSWVDILNPKFTKHQIHNFATEVSVFRRVMTERYHRGLQQNHPRLYLQFVLLNACFNIEPQMTEILLCLDDVLKDASFRNSPIGKDCEVFAQKLDFWMVQFAATSGDFIDRIGRYLEALSDEEIALKLETFNARAASAQLPYFNPAQYSGTIDPVFWPRALPLGM